MTRIFFSVGEPSGDLHGANLIRELQQQCPDMQCVGYGGPQMAEAGCQLHAELTQLAVMWLSRVLLNLHVFWSLLWKADRFFRDERPDAVVLIDYPGFNWWIARRAKARGIPVFYYGTPQIWAWASWRVRKLRRLVDHSLCKLQFEAEWYQARGCRATFVGHPYFDDLRQQKLDEDFLHDVRKSEEPLITVLPGSRRQEVEMNLPAFAETLRYVCRTKPQVRVVVAAYNQKLADMATQLLSSYDLPVKVVCGKTRELIRAADCCLACSGSVSLELLYECKPTVIHYAVSPLAFRIQRALRRVKYITLVNLLANEDRFREGADDYDPDFCPADQVPFPEYLTCRDAAPQMAHHLVRWLTNDMARQQTVDILSELKAEVVTYGAPQRGARFILGQLLSGNGPLVPRPHFLPPANASDRRPTSTAQGSCQPTLPDEQ